jgi:hypothetical protein
MPQPAGTKRLSTVQRVMYKQLGLPRPTHAALNTIHAPKKMPLPGLTKYERLQARCEFCGKKEQLKWAGDAWLCRSCDVDDLREGWDEPSGPLPDSEWTGAHPGYEFMIVTYKRGVRQTVATKLRSLPKARTLARVHHRKTGETVVVIDSEGRKYFTL